MTRVTLGSYELDAILGDGGMGTVYRGRDRRTGRVVAIKVLHPHYRRDPAFVSRFRAEAVIQATLSHPHIVPVIDLVDDESTLAIVLEFVNGVPLSELLRQAGGRLDEARALRLIDQLLDALSHAHRQGVIHRDIKPSNIIITRSGNHESAKLLDFGIAKVPGDEKLKTATGTKMGTLAYMAPEQIQSPKDVDPRADLYSVGMILYEMVAGRGPFDAQTDFGLMQQIVGVIPKRLDLVHPTLAETIGRALQKRPDDRFQTADRMRATLGMALRTRSAITVRGGHALKLQVPTSTRRWVMASLAALVGLAAIAWGAWALTRGATQVTAPAVDPMPTVQMKPTLPPRVTSLSTRGRATAEAPAPSPTAAPARLVYPTATPGLSPALQSDAQAPQLTPRVQSEPASTEPVPDLPPEPPVTTPATALAPPEPLRVGGQVKAPRKIRDVAPIYPSAARSARIQGIVIIEATLGVDGSVRDARVIRTAGPLDQAALRAVRQWRYEPPTLNGVPVPVVMTVTVNFTLR